MNIRTVLGLAAVSLTMMAATVVPALAGMGVSPAAAILPASEVVLIDSGVIELPDGGAISAYAVTRSGQ